MEKSVESGYANIAAIEKYYRNGYFAVLLWTKIAAIEKSAESGYANIAAIEKSFESGYFAVIQRSTDDLYVR